MLAQVNAVLSGWRMTGIAGVFLAASFFLPMIGYSQMEQLAWVAVMVCGLPLLYLSVFRLVKNQGIRKISSALLISMAMIAALLIGDLFAAGEVAFIMAIGALLEDMTTNRAKQGLKKLLALEPETGRLIRNNQETIVRVTEIKTGDLLRILPGETIPVDGVIREGETSVDQSVMTGESLPVDKAAGDAVFSGTLNQFGAIDVTATKVGEDSSLQKLIRMVAEAEAKQAPTQRIADKAASWLVPAALLIAIGTYFFTGEIVRAVTVLVVFCPCALVLATPTAITAAIGQATKHGVIIKSGEALEKMGKVNTMAFDKTGTLTYGRLAVNEVLPMADMTLEELLQIAASAESRSEHPLGKAIAEDAKAKGVPLYEAADFGMMAGKGIIATVKGVNYILGNEKLLRERGIAITEKVKQALEKIRTEGKASVIVANTTDVLGIIALSDVLRPEAADMVRTLAGMDTEVVLLTGDNQTAAAYFAARVGIRKVAADLLPEDKVKHIVKLKKEKCVSMIGDGVNDAPALKTADVGVAMGVMGSDIAIEAADVALMTDDISKIPYLKWLANATVRTIHTAILLSMLINFCAILLSVQGVLTPTTGALVHNAGSCFVVLLAALLYDRKYRSGQPGRTS
ncbi:MAG: heavy metal translocating P-type ATPase [Schwartzia sp. (in: firmicutes)]